MLVTRNKCRLSVFVSLASLASLASLSVGNPAWSNSLRASGT